MSSRGRWARQWDSCSKPPSTGKTPAALSLKADFKRGGSMSSSILCREDSKNSTLKHTRTSFIKPRQRGFSFCKNCVILLITPWAIFIYANTGLSARKSSQFRHYRAHRCGQDDYVRARAEEHTSELQSHVNLVCRLLLA